MINYKEKIINYKNILNCENKYIGYFPVLQIQRSVRELSANTCPRMFVGGDAHTVLSLLVLIHLSYSDVCENRVAEFTWKQALSWGRRMPLSVYVMKSGSKGLL